MQQSLKAMPIFSEKAVQEKQKKQQLWQKVILFIGAGSFLATAMIPLVTGLIDSLTKPAAEQVAATPQELQMEQLKQKETGFLTVLEREPNNPNALQGLVDTRLKLGDLAGAKEPLQQLIKIYPNEQVLKDLLAQVEDQLGNTSTSTTPTNASPTTPPANAPAPKAP